MSKVSDTLNSQFGKTRVVNLPKNCDNKCQEGSASCKLEVLANHLGGSWYHLFMVFTDATGKKFYLRGGPSAEGPGESSGISSELGGESSHTSSMRSSGSGSHPSASSGSPYGNIDTEYGEYKPGTIDWNPDAKSVEVASCSEVCPKYQQLIKQMDAIKDAKIRYSPLGPNSNSVVFTALKNIGITLKFPEGVWSPGSDFLLPLKK